MSYIKSQGNQISIAEAARAPDRVPIGISGLNPIGKVAAWSAAHRWWVIAASVTIFVLTIFVMGVVETKTLDYNGEGEAAEGAQLVEDGFQFNSAPTEQLVFSNPSLDVESPVFRSTVQGLVDQLAVLPEVKSVVSYYDTGNQEMVSEDGHVVLAQVVVAGESELADEKIEAILDAVYAANADEPGFEISMAGISSIDYELGKIDEEDFSSMIIITMILALSLMLIAFRGVVAAFIPLVLAIGSIFTALVQHPDIFD